MNNKNSHDFDGCDMIVSLNNLPVVKCADGVKIKRAFVGDKEAILNFIEKNFSKSWIYEA